MPNKIILVDGHSLIYRAFHALPLLDDGNGLFTNAIYGFFAMLFKVIADEKPDGAAVAFDLHGPTFRHETFKEYKAGRAPTPEEMRPQVPIVKELLEQMHIPILTLEGFEADDILGTVSKSLGVQGVDALIVTGDRDAFQLADNSTDILYTKRGITDTDRVTVSSIREKYELTPAQLIDVKGLMGDKSDNIPGIPGIGEKTAVKLIVEYGTLESALEHADRDQKGKLRERLLTYADQARLSKRLATIDRDAPVDYDIDQMRLHDLQDARPAFEQYKLKTLIPRLQQLTGAKVQAPGPIEVAGVDWSEAVETADAQEIARIAEKWNDADRVAFSIGANIDVATGGGDELVIPLGGDLLTPGIDEVEALSALKPLIEGGAQKIVHHIKKLRATLEAAGASLGGEAFDLYLAAYCINSQRKSYALADLLGDQGNFTQERPARAMLEMMPAMRAQMERDGVTALYDEMERPLADVLYDMEREGFLVDAAELTRLGDEFSGHILKLSDRIHELAGREININSPKQLGELLFDDFQLTGGKKTKSGYSTSADVLEQIADQHEIIPLILEYRKYTKLMSTYIEALLRLRSPDGRIHTSFDQTAAATGRISSLEPNLQNIPIRTELGREIRRAFIARPGWLLVDADYSQIELRVLAHISGDETMCDAFLRDQDIHRRTAAEVYGVPIDEVTGAMRSAAKAVNFGIVYGISDFGLARNTGMTRREASEFIARYFDRYPGVKRFMDDAVTMGKTQGYVTTLFGRRRYLDELNSSNYNTRSFGERAAMNSPIQGTAADIIKLAMARVHGALNREKLAARLILQVHDELIIEAPEAEVERVSELLKQQMESVIELKVPLKTDLAVGRNWYDCKS